MKSHRNPTPSHYAALLQLLRTANTVWEASRVFFDRWELSPSQFNVLNLLHAETTGLSQVELSRQLLMHRSNVTGLVDRLEKRGLVRRQDAAADRRAYRVVLTSAGAALLEEILPRYYEAADLVWERFPASRITELTADLHQLAQNAEQAVRQLSPVA